MPQLLSGHFQIVDISNPWLLRGSMGVPLIYIHCRNALCSRGSGKNYCEQCEKAGEEVLLICE